MGHNPAPAASARRRVVITGIGVISSIGTGVAEFTEGGYRIRRLSDGSILGELFSRDDVRRQRNRQGFWWH